MTTVQVSCSCPFGVGVKMHFFPVKFYFRDLYSSRYSLNKVNNCEQTLAEHVYFLNARGEIKNKGKFLNITRTVKTRLNGT